VSVHLLSFRCVMSRPSLMVLCLKVQRLATDDQVRKIVREEGRTARNLVTWNVPLADQGNVM